MYQPKICEYEKFWDDVVAECEQIVKTREDLDYRQSALPTIADTIDYIERIRSSYNEIKDFVLAVGDRDKLAAYVIDKLDLYPRMRQRIVSDDTDLLMDKFERSEAMEYIFRTGRYAVSKVPSNPLVKAIQREALAHVEIQIDRAEAHLKRLEERLSEQ